MHTGYDCWRRAVLVESGECGGVARTGGYWGGTSPGLPGVDERDSQARWRSPRRKRHQLANGRGRNWHRASARLDRDRRQELWLGVNVGPHSVYGGGRLLSPFVNKFLPPLNPQRPHRPRLKRDFVTRPFFARPPPP